MYEKGSEAAIGYCEKGTSYSYEGWNFRSLFLIFSRKSKWENIKNMNHQYITGTLHN